MAFAISVQALVDDWGQIMLKKGHIITHGVTWSLVFAFSGFYIYFDFLFFSGYYKLGTIPAGATNIDIRELGKTAVFLSMFSALPNNLRFLE